MNPDHLPPHSLEAEQALLGSLLVDRDAIIRVVDRLGPEAFFVTANQTIYRAIVALYKVRKPADFVVLTDLLRDRGKLDEIGGVAYLSSLLLAVHTATHVDYYANMILAYAARRAMIEQASSLVAASYRGDVDIDEVVGSLRRSVEPFQVSTEPEVIFFADGMTDHRHRVVDRWEGRLVERIVPTGIRSIDQLIMGGFRPGNLVFIGARPGMGKTAWMLQQAQFAAMVSGKVSLIVELEMDTEALFDRAIAADAGVPFDVAYKQFGDLRQRETWLSASEHLESLPVGIATGLRTTDKIAAYCDRMQSEREIGAIYIDHLDYLADRTRGDTAEQRTAELTRRCKSLAQNVGCPVIVLSQLNREVESTKPFTPNLKHFRNSGAIEQDTDFAFLLYRRKYYVDKGMIDPDANLDYVTASDQHKVDLFLAKNRNGEVTAVELGWHAPTMSFHETRRSA